MMELPKLYNICIYYKKGMISSLHWSIISIVQLSAGLPCGEQGHDEALFHPDIG